MRRRSFLALVASMPLFPVAGVVSAARMSVAADDSGLATLLGLLPEASNCENGVFYANYAAQRAALSITGTGAAIDRDAWIAAMSGPLMIPHAMSGVPLDPIWRDVLGFDLRDIDQMVQADVVNDHVLILTGRFNASALPAAWEAGGYAPIKTGGVIWHTLGADYVMFDPDVPLSNWHQGRLSHLALLDGGTVIGTATRVGMEHTLALHAGEGHSFVDGAGAELVTTASGNIAAGWIIDGVALATIGAPLASMATNPNVEADARERLKTQVAETATEAAEEAPRMPPLALVLIGITAGVAAPLTAQAFPEGPQGHSIVVVVPEDAANAEMVAETARRRLATLAIPSLASDGGGRPYAEEFPSIVIEVTPSGTVVIDLTLAPNVPAGRLIDLQQMGLLSFLFWAE